jgi:nickel/cobalt exporter
MNKPKYSQVLRGNFFAFFLLTFVLAIAQGAWAHPGHEPGLETLVQHRLSPALMLAGLGIAFVTGAGHALSPGHGKTMVAAYLVGSHSTPQQAVVLGLITTFTHTISVFALGGLALLFSQYILPEKLTPILSAIGGLTVFGVGVWLLKNRLDSASPCDCHHHHHHPHPHPHSHLPGTPITLASLMTLGVAGGIVPCPSALVLLLSAIALNQPAYGMALVSGFSLGLASVLIAIGLIVVYSRHYLDRLPKLQWLQRYLPIFSAALVMWLGIALTVYTFL